MPRPECPVCHGTGNDPSSPLPADCAACWGTGEMLGTSDKLDILAERITKLEADIAIAKEMWNEEQRMRSNLL